MLVTLDGERLEHAFESDRTLASLVDDVRGRFLGARLVVSVAVNGTALTDAALSRRLRETVSAGDQVDLESAERAELVRDALHQASRELAAAAGEHRVLADALNAGHVAAAMGQMRALIGVWQGCQQAVLEGGSLLGRDFTTCVFEGRAIAMFLAELAEKLRNLREALDAQDMVSLADLACYELPPLCATWGNLLGSLAADIECPPQRRS